MESVKTIQVDDPATDIAFTSPATEEEINTVLFAPQTDDGRSEFKWLLLASGDLYLTVSPCGELYEKMKVMLKARDWPLI